MSYGADSKRMNAVVERVEWHDGRELQLVKLSTCQSEERGQCLVVYGPRTAAHEVKYKLAESVD